MNELGAILDDENSFALKKEDKSLKNGKNVVKTTRTELKRNHPKRKSFNQVTKKHGKSRKESLSSINSMNTSVVTGDKSAFNPVIKSIQKVCITDELIKNSLQQRKTKLRDKLERKLGLNQFSYAKKCSQNAYSSSAQRKRRTHSLINKQI